MMALPDAFLPFDPNHESEDSDDEDEEVVSYPESDEDNLPDTISNGEDTHEPKQARHIGGGVLLVRKNLLYLFFSKTNH
jgi:hypothetical protein